MTTTSRPGPGPVAGPNPDLTKFVAANEVVLAQQAAGLLQISEEEAAERLELLQDQNWVSRVQLDSRLSPGYRVTRQAAVQINPALPPLRPLSRDTYRHEIGTVWLWVAAAHGSFGKLRDEPYSRRQMQAADLTWHNMPDTAAAAFKDQPDPAAEPDPQAAYPDLGLLPHDGGWVSVDLVLTPLDPARARSRLTRARRDPRLRAQMFLVDHDHKDTAEIINSAAAQLGLADQVRTKMLASDGIVGA